MKKAFVIIGKVVQWLIVAALLLVLLFNLVTLISRAVTKDEIPLVLGFGSAIVATGSMSGSIEPNDLVVIKNEDSYAVGDVITFKSNSSYVTHRIVSINEDGTFITKGDANNAQDATPVTLANVKGKVTLVIPKVGSVIEFMRKPVGIIVLVAVLVLLAGVPSLIQNVKERKQDNRITE